LTWIGARRQSYRLRTLSILEIIYCCVVLVLSYGLRGSTGFGSAAAMPLLGLVVPMKLLVPVWTLLGVSSSVTIVARDWRHICTDDFWRILPALAAGFGIGLWLFKALDARTITWGLGLLVIGYGAYALWGTFQAVQRRPLPVPVVAPACGLIAGAVGTLFGTMASLFFVIYLDAKQLGKTQFRATASAMILTLSIARSAGYLAVGEFSREVLWLFAIALPMMLVGIWIGDRVHTGLSELTFRRLVCAVLIASGIALLATSK
jgi:uncharacterized protein